MADSTIVATWGDHAGIVRSRYYVYSIKCKANNKQYIGETCYPKQRFRNHLYSLRKGKHYNKSLQADFNQFGEEQFEIRILETTEDYEPTARSAEQRWIRKTSASDPSKGYNNDKTSKAARGEHPCPWTRHNKRKRVAFFGGE